MTEYQRYSSLQAGCDRYSSKGGEYLLEADRVRKAGWVDLWDRNLSRRCFGLATLFMDAAIAFKARTASPVVPVADAACDEPVDLTWLNG